MIQWLYALCIFINTTWSINHSHVFLLTLSNFMNNWLVSIFWPCWLGLFVHSSNIFNYLLGQIFLIFDIYWSIFQELNAFRARLDTILVMRVLLLLEEIKNLMTVLLIIIILFVDHKVSTVCTFFKILNS